MKYIPYGKQTIDKEDIASVVDALRSDWISQGPMVRKFEDALCKYTGAKYAVAVSSGTAALHIASLVAGVKPKDNVITSPLTFIASANCILYCGGKPIFADIQEDTINIDPEEIRKKVNKRTKAIIPVHFAGHPCELEKIQKTAQKHNLVVIEDAAHALGADYKVNGKWFKIGSCQHSDMSVFSFHPVKAITTGEGGAVTTNNRKLYERLLMFRNHGITKDSSKFKMFRSQFTRPWYYEMQFLGLNYRITDIQCALGISQLKKLTKFIKIRREIAQIYNKELSKIEKIDLPIEKRDVRSAWHLYPIKLKIKSNLDTKRREIFTSLRKNGIGVQVHYIPVHLHPYYRNLFGYKQGNYPKSEKYYRQTITLPLYPRMKTREVKYVIKIVKKLLK